MRLGLGRTGYANIKPRKISPTINQNKRIIMPTTITKTDIYTFDFWKFRADVFDGRTYQEVCSELNVQGVEISYNSMNGRINKKIPFRMTEFLEWCGALDLNPTDYIQMNEENIQ